jgi:DNA primase
VAPLGTALTAEHVGALKKLSHKIYLALDADTAGVNATLKGVGTLQENLDGHFVPVPTPQGFIRWERELDAEIKIIALPDGKDPDEVIQAEPEAWRTLVAAARPAMDFYIEAYTRDLDLRSAKGKARAVELLAPLVAQIANPVEQAHHIQQIARLVEVEERAIRLALPSRKHQPDKRPALVMTPSAGPSREDYMLGWLLRYQAARTAVQEKIRRDLLPFPLVGEIIEGTLLELFERVENRAIWWAWLDQPPGTNPAEWARDLDDSLQEQAQQVLGLELPESQAYRYVNDALECARMLQLDLARRWKNRVTEEVAAAESEEDQIAAKERLVQIKSYMDSISIPKRSSAYDKDLHSLHAI